MNTYDGTVICDECYAPVSPDDDGFYACEHCGCCYGLGGDEDSVLEQPETCPLCNKSDALYSKADAGYPGLYHCAECGWWIDKNSGKTWKFERIEHAQ